MSSPPGNGPSRANSLDVIEVVKNKSGRRTQKTIRVGQGHVDDFTASVAKKSSHRPGTSKKPDESSPYLQAWEVQHDDEEARKKKKASKKSLGGKHKTSDDVDGKHHHGSIEVPSKKSMKKSIFGHRIMTHLSHPAHTEEEPTEVQPQRSKSVSNVDGGQNMTPEQLLNEVKRSLDSISTLKILPNTPPSSAPRTSKDLGPPVIPPRTSKDLGPPVIPPRTSKDLGPPVIPPKPLKTSWIAFPHKVSETPVIPHEPDFSNKSAQTIGTPESHRTSIKTAIPPPVPLKRPSDPRRSKGQAVTPDNHRNSYGSTGTRTSLTTSKESSETQWLLLYGLALLVLIISGILLYIALLKSPPPPVICGRFNSAI